MLAQKKVQVDHHCLATATKEHHQDTSGAFENTLKV